MKLPLNIIRSLLLSAATVCLFALPAFAQSSEEISYSQLPETEITRTAESDYLLTSDGNADQSGWVETLYGTLYKDTSGRTVTGWQQIDGSWYYFSSEHMLMHGWVKVGNFWYYLDPDTGIMQTGWLTLNDDSFYLDESGVMATGWQQINNAWYYFDNSGLMQTGWINQRGTWYYLDPDTGIMQTGWLTLADDGTYYLYSSGAMACGWVHTDNSWYYFDSSGRQQTGWIASGRTWYYLDPDTGVMQTGWLEQDGGWYFLRSTGIMAKGWCYIDSEWYYFYTSGHMATGWTIVNGYQYYLYTEDDPNGGKYGTMAHDVTIDGQELLSSGHAVTSIKERMYNYVCNSTSSTGYAIAVDTTACYVGIYTGSKGNWTLKYFWPCAPGASSTPTVTGTFTVGIKGYYFDSYGSRCYYYTQFCGNYLFHSVLYNQAGQLTDGRVGQRLSHGCVRLQIENAKWIYNYIPKGTVVYVYT